MQVVLKCKSYHLCSSPSSTLIVLDCQQRSYIALSTNYPKYCIKPQRQSIQRHGSRLPQPSITTLPRQRICTVCNWYCPTLRIQRVDSPLKTTDHHAISRTKSICALYTFKNHAAAQQQFLQFEGLLASSNNRPCQWMDCYRQEGRKAGGR